MIDNVYTVWGSEDEGFRYPVGDTCYVRYEDALAAAQEEAGTKQVVLDGGDKEVELTGAPSTHGEVVSVLAYADDEVTSIEEALEKVGDDPEGLYAIDWAYIIKVPVKYTPRG